MSERTALRLSRDWSSHRLFNPPITPTNRLRSTRCSAISAICRPILNSNTSGCCPNSSKQRSPIFSIQPVYSGKLSFATALAQKVGGKESRGGPLSCSRERQISGKNSSANLACASGIFSNSAQMCRNTGLSALFAEALADASRYSLAVMRSICSRVGRGFGGFSWLTQPALLAASSGAVAR